MFAKSNTLKMHIELIAIDGWIQTQFLFTDTKKNSQISCLFSNPYYHYFRKGTEIFIKLISLNINTYSLFSFFLCLLTMLVSRKVSFCLQLGPLLWFLNLTKTISNFNMNPFASSCSATFFTWPLYHSTLPRFHIRNGFL